MWWNVIWKKMYNCTNNVDISVWNMQIKTRWKMHQLGLLACLICFGSLLFFLKPKSCYTVQAWFSCFSTLSTRITSITTKPNSKLYFNAKITKIAYGVLPACQGILHASLHLPVILMLTRQTALFKCHPEKRLGYKMRKGSD